MEKSHGMSQTRLYTVWKNMKQRCYNPKRNRYQWYGGKGIKVCDEWHTFLPFMEWALANGYEDGLVLDRESSEGHYEPSNCSWVTIEENSLKAVSQRTGKPVKGDEYKEYNGRTQKISEWAEEYDIPYKNLYSRLRLKWDMDRALTQPVRKSPSK
jgi:hypothetical protein